MDEQYRLRAGLGYLFAALNFVARAADTLEALESSDERGHV